MQTCFVCHQPEGQGVVGQIPPLAGSDYLAADKERAVRTVLQGLSGEITVLGKKYNGIMIPLNYLGDDEIANVVTYVRNSWGNTGDVVSPDLVRTIRSEAGPATTAAPSEFE
jgi:nitrite reductase (NO-forming)